MIPDQGMAMKCYKCGQEASVAMRAQAMVMSREVIRFYCTACFDSKAWKKD